MLFNFHWLKKLVYFNRGQSLLEVILALAVFALISAVMVVMSAGGFVTLQQGGEQTRAEFMALEGLEAVRSIRDRDWNELIFTASSVSVSNGQWVFDGEGTSETIGGYQRLISLAVVCRDDNHDITICPGAYTDSQSKKITVQISWEARPGVSNFVKRSTYLTNWGGQIDFD